MAFNFILMLAGNDRTIPEARARLEEALEGGVRHIGFKDVGLPFEDLRGLAQMIRAAGGRSYLEVVSLDEESELASARAAVDLDVDCLLGGTRAAAVTEVTRDHPLRYYPFPGRITGHPSVLEGPAEEIVASARGLADLEHVHGLDLLAYRFQGDVPDLMRRVAAAVTKPVIVAGSIDSAARIATVAGAGAAGFTVGTAAIGRASCRERVEVPVVAVSLKKKNSKALPSRSRALVHTTNKYATLRSTLQTYQQDVPHTESMT